MRRGGLSFLYNILALAVINGRDEGIYAVIKKMLSKMCFLTKGQYFFNSNRVVLDGVVINFICV